MPTDNKRDASAETGLPAVPAHLAGKFTPEQWARRQALADKMRKFSTGGVPRPHRPQVRLILVLILGGSAFLLGGVLSLAGILNMSNDAKSADPGLAHQSLGPHGGDILALIIGIVLLGAGLTFLFKNARKARSERANSGVAER